MKQESSFWFTCATPEALTQQLKGEWLNGDNSPRVAFIGRSNVGKSTLINCLLGQNLARTSSTPGKTRALQFFKWTHQKKMILVDLPGYGFAKVPKEERDSWKKLLDQYLEHDPMLQTLLLLWDARIGPTESDLEAFSYFQEKEAPLTIVMTKTDQLKSQSDRSKRKREVEEFLKKIYETNSPKLFWISTKSKDDLSALRYHLLHGHSS